MWFRNKTHQMSLPGMDETDLTPDEVETLGSIVRGGHQGLRARDLVQLKLFSADHDERHHDL